MSLFDIKCIIIHEDIEPIPYTLGNFSVTDPFVREILQTGIRIV